MKIYLTRNWNQTMVIASAQRCLHWTKHSSIPQFIKQNRFELQKTKNQYNQDRIKIENWNQSMKEFNPNQSMEAFIATFSGSARDQVLNQKKRKARRVESDRQSNAPLILVWVRIPAYFGVVVIRHFMVASGPAASPAHSPVLRCSVTGPAAPASDRRWQCTVIICLEKVICPTENGAVTWNCVQTHLTRSLAWVDAAAGRRAALCARLVQLQANTAHANPKKRI